MQELHDCNRQHCRLKPLVTGSYADVLCTEIDPQGITAVGVIAAKDV
jgi:hypothetical protein